MKYRKKPVEIEALQLGSSPASLAEIVEWAEGHGTHISADFDDCESHCLSIQTLEGTMTANVDDWVIRDIKGEFYPCKPDIFEATYDTV